jgi:hypothetical protein
LQKNFVTKGNKIMNKDLANYVAKLIDGYNSYDKSCVHLFYCRF